MPIYSKQLAQHLMGVDFNRLTLVTNSRGEADTHFLDGKAGPLINFGEFQRYIPIVAENVSIKKHDYRTKTHIVFWVAGEPYIHTPAPTVEYIRQGFNNRKLARGSHLMIPHNCETYDLIKLKETKQKCGDDNIKVDIEMLITRHKLKG